MKNRIDLVNVKDNNKTCYNMYNNQIANHIDVDKFDLIWASIYANRENKKVKNIRKRLEHDIANVEYYFDLSNGVLKINTDLNNLEQTQKAQASLRIGFIICNIVGKKIFNVRHLHHLQGFTGMNINLKGSKRPDFIARNGNNYFVIEAKGTLNTSNTKQITDGLEQLNAISTINGNKPYKFIIQSFIVNDEVRANVIDPPGEGEEIEIKESRFNNYKELLRDQDSTYFEINNQRFNGYWINDYFIGFIDGENLSNEDRSFNNSDDFDGRFFSDGTVILKKKHNSYGYYALNQANHSYAYQ